MTLKDVSARGIHSRGRPLPPALITWARLLVAKSGESGALSTLGISRNALYRGLAGLPVLPGTEALFREAKVKGEGSGPEAA